MAKLNRIPFPHRRDQEGDQMFNFCGSKSDLNKNDLSVVIIKWILVERIMQTREK